MNDEHKIIQQVYAAKEDMEAADRLIEPICRLSRQKPQNFSNARPWKDTTMN